MKKILILLVIIIFNTTLWGQNSYVDALNTHVNLVRKTQKDLVLLLKSQKFKVLYTGYGSEFAKTFTGGVDNELLYEMKAGEEGLYLKLKAGTKKEDVLLQTITKIQEYAKTHQLELRSSQYRMATKTEHGVATFSLPIVMRLNDQKEVRLALEKEAKEEAEKESAEQIKNELLKFEEYADAQKKAAYQSLKDKEYQKKYDEVVNFYIENAIDEKSIDEAAKRLGKLLGIDKNKEVQNILKKGLLSHFNTEKKWISRGTLASHDSLRAMEFRIAFIGEFLKSFVRELLK